MFWATDAGSGLGCFVGIQGTASIVSLTVLLQILVSSLGLSFTLCSNIGLVDKRTSEILLSLQVADFFVFVDILFFGSLSLRITVPSFI